MKRSKWLLVLSLLLTLSIYASPAKDSLEFLATLCHFSDTGLTCSCPEEAKENRQELENSVKKARRKPADQC